MSLLIASVEIHDQVCSAPDRLQKLTLGTWEEGLNSDLSLGQEVDFGIT